MTRGKARAKTCRKCGYLELTPRQEQILRLMADPAELSIEDIGKQLGKTRSTAKNAASALYAALGVKTRMGAVLKAIEFGIVAKVK